MKNIILLLFIALSIPAFSHVLDYDEAFTALNYTASPLHALGLYTAPNNHMLHSLFVWLTTALFGSTALAVRLPALLASALALLLAYRVGNRWSGERAGLLAMLLLMTAPGFVTYAVNARGYSLSIALTLALVDLLAFTRPVNRRRYRYALMAVCAALVLTLPTMVVLIGMAALWAWTCDRRVLMPLIVGSLTGLAFYAPHLSEIAAHGARFAQPFDVSLFALVAQTGPLLLIVGLVGVWNLKRREALAGAAVVLVSLLVLRPFARNYLFLLPLLALVSAVWLDQLPTALWRGLAVALGGLAIVSALGTAQPTAFDRLLHEAHLYRDGARLAVDWSLNEPLRFAAPELLHGGNGVLAIVTDRAALSDLAPSLSCARDYRWSFEAWRCHASQGSVPHG